MNHFYIYDDLSTDSLLNRKRGPAVISSTAPRNWEPVMGKRPIWGIMKMVKSSKRLRNNS
jgi:hypothetical protein